MAVNSRLQGLFKEAHSGGKPSGGKNLQTATPPKNKPRVLFESVAENTKGSYWGGVYVLNFC